MLDWHPVMSPEAEARKASLARGVVVLAMIAAMLMPRGAFSAGEPQASDIVGRMAVHEVRHEETIPRLAQRYGLGFVELMAANPGVDPWLPGEGRKVMLPSAHILPDAPREGIVINLAELRLYHFRRDGSVATYPVGIGRDYWETPQISTAITLKRKNPVWTPPASIRAEKPYLPAQIGPGPDNPLGDFAMNLGFDSYVIHGTNKPLGVGRRVSHGCIRLYPEHIAILFDEVSPGTPVRIISQEIKFGWSDGALFLEAHASQEHADAIETGAIANYPMDVSSIAALLATVPGAADADLDWPLIEMTVRERRGVPIQISRRPRPEF